MSDLLHAPARDTAISRRDQSIAAGLAVGILLLYSLTRLQVHNQCVDCTSYAGTIQRAEPTHMVQGAHLIYLSLISSFQLLFQRIAPDLTSFLTAQIVNSVAAALAVGSLFLLARRIGIGSPLAASLSLMLAFAYTFWTLSIDVEVHAPAVLLLLFSLLLVVSPGREFSSRRIVLLGALSALATLFHVFSGLSVPIIGGLLLLDPENNQTRLRRSRLARISPAIVYLATVLIGVAVPYLIVMTRVLHLHSFQEMASWIFSFMSDPGFADRAGLPLMTTLTLAGTGLVRAMLSVISWVATPGLGGFLGQAFAQRCIVEEMYLTRNLSSVIASFSSLSSVVAGGLILVLFVRGARGLVIARRRLPRIVAALILWLLLYAVLLMVAAPASSEHWVFYWLPALLLVMGFGLAENQQQTRPQNAFGGVAAGAVILLLAANLPNILLQRNAENDLYLHRLGWYQANSGPQDLIITAGGYKWNSYLEYYLSARTEMLDRRFRTMPVPSFIELAEDEIRAILADGGRVFVMQDVLEPEMCQARIGNWDLAGISTFRQAILPRLDCFSAGDVKICEVTS